MTTHATPAVVPHSFLFRYSFDVPYVAGLPKTGRKLLSLPQRCVLPDVSGLDNRIPFGELRLAWNVQGLGLSLRVQGKKFPLSCDAANPTESDGLQVWIDTRNTQSIHRASRFCHYFCLLPAGAGVKRDKPVGVQLPIARAKEDAPIAKSADVAMSVETQRDGYELSVWLPSEVLYGFDPDANPFLGFYYMLRDAELGEQFLSVGHEFPFAHDPSLWATLALQR